MLLLGENETDRAAESLRRLIPRVKDALGEVRRVAIDVFRAVDASGYGRVDFLMEKATGKLVVNEINTIPGFTTISMFSKLWEASGVDYSTLIDRLIALAIARHGEKQALRTSAF